MDRESFDFRMMAEALPHMVWLARPDGSTQYLNLLLQEFFGVDAGALQGWSWQENVHPDDRPRAVAAWQDAVANGASYQLEYRLRRKDGVYLWHEMRAAPVRDATGAIVNWLGTETNIDERKRVEEQLSESERKFRMLHESMRDAFVSVSMDGRVQEFNAAYLDLLGYSPEELRTKTYVDLTPEKWHAVEARIVAEQILPRSYSDVYEKEYRRKDGTLIPVELRTVLMRAVDGTPELMWATIRDISERKKSENELRLSEEKFLKAFRSGPSLMTINDFTTGRFVDVNEAFVRVSGYSREEAIGQTADALGWARSEDLQYLFALLEEAGRVADWEVEVTGKLGQSIWCQYFGEVIETNTGRMLLSIAQDVTERKQAEESLRLSEDRFAKAFQNSPLLMTLSDLATGRYIEVNEVFCRVSGFAREEAVGRTSVELGWVGTAERQFIFEELTSKGRVSGQELKLTNKRGETVWCQYFGELLSTRSGQMVLSIAKDITESRAIAEALERAKLAAETASRAKSEFLANMSHEIRTPITGIMGMAELLEGTELTPAQRSYLMTILRSSENLLELVNDILDLSKIEAGKIEIVRKNFSLRDLVNDVIDNQRPLIAGKGLQVRIDVASTVPDNVCGDLLKLKQVLLNLVGNAVKFTSRGEVSLSVAVNEFKGSRLDLDFAVGDTGIGIRSELLKKIFEPFQQGDSSAVRSYGGTGLGLAICTRLVGLLGGQIQVESREGVGSTFRVRVPLALAQGGGEARVVLEASRSALPGLSILVVEDSDASRMFFVEVLQKHGHRVEIARNGAEALAKLTQGRYDLVLLDIQMPVMDGLTAIDKIRATEQVQGGHLPVVAITAHAMEHDRKMFLQQGFDGYLAKPTRIRDLLDEVERCRRLRSSAPAGSATS